MLHLIDTSRALLSRVNGFDVVFLCDLVCQGCQIGHLHIRRQRIELRGAPLVAVSDVHRQRDAKSFRQQLPQLDGSVRIQPLDGFALAFLHALFQATPARNRHVGRNTDIGEVSKRGVGLCNSSPSTLFVEPSEPQFIDPQLCTLGFAVIGRPKRLFEIFVWVSNADHDRDHVA